MAIFPRRSPRRLTACTAVIGSMIAGCTHTSHDAESPLWNLTFSDEFDGPGIDRDKWEVLTRKDSHNNEKQYYLPQQASIVDGTLRITATNEPYDGKAYRSARLESWFSQAYGRFEARAKLPTTRGLWPAFWLLPRTTKWPHGGEIDIMENAGSRPDRVTCAFHYANDAGNHEHVHHQHAARDAAGNPVLFSEGFHVYAVQWSPYEMVFFVDGVEIDRVNKERVPVPSTPMSVILNAAVGGWFDGDPDETTVFPQHFDIDYVRVYRISNGAPESESVSLSAEDPTNSNK